MPEELLTGKVLAQERAGDRLRILKVAAARLEFTAGQFTKVGLPGEDGKPVLRAYSFVSSPEESDYEFCYDVLVEGGKLTPRLDMLESGDELLLGARPNGLLVVRELPAAKNLFMFATGTGVGPFISICKTVEPWEKFERVILVLGVRYAADLIYSDAIMAIAQRHPQQFCYIPLVTREQAPPARRDRCTKLLVDGGLEQASGVTLGPDCQFMLCGNPTMIKQMSELLKERGFERNRRARPGNVTIEKYW